MERYDTQSDEIKIDNWNNPVTWTQFLHNNLSLLVRTRRMSSSSTDFSFQKIQKKVFHLENVWIKVRMMVKKRLDKLKNQQSI